MNDMHLFQVEIGDAQIVLSYSSEQKKLNVMVKTVKISSSNLLDHLTGTLLLLTHPLYLL